MSHFRFVPRAALWRHPTATGVRQPRWRSRKPPVRPGWLDLLPTRCSGWVEAPYAGLNSAELPLEEPVELAPVHLDADRSRVKRRLDHLIKTYNRAHPGQVW
ncbi:hypothetical protein ACW73L_18595 [Methylolobus aquaticus]